MNLFKKQPILIALVSLFIISQDINSQSVCGLNGGTLDIPGPVSAGTLGVVMIDIADNGGLYPTDALLPASITLEFTNPVPETVETSQDYSYLTEVSNADGSTYLLETLTSFDPSDPQGDGSIPALTSGASYKETGWAYSIDQFRYIQVEIFQNQFVCPTFLEPGLPEGFSCEDIYAIPPLNSLLECLELTNLIFGNEPSDQIADAICALGQIDQVLAGVNISATPCYAMTGWTDPNITSISVLENLPNGASSDEIKEALSTYIDIDETVAINEIHQYYITNINTAIELPLWFGDEEGLEEYSEVMNGSLSYLEDISFTYTPNLDYTGLDEFVVITYDVVDGVYTDYIIHIGVGYPECSDITETDCVWPGDANNDNICNNMDVLSLGLGAGFVGFERATITNVWQGYESWDWQEELNGVNAKYADCDGNGLIGELNDLNAILNNYDFIHSKTGQEKGTADDPVLRLEMPVDLENSLEGDLLNANISYGDSDLGVEDLYGIAFSLHFGGALMDMSSLEFNLSNSWLGENEDLISLNKVVGPDQVDIAITRMDQQAMDGFGELLSFSIVMDEIIYNGADAAVWLSASFENVRIIDAEGLEKPFITQLDSLQLVLGNVGEHLSEKINIYPNPVSDICHIDLDDVEINSLEIRTIEGRLIYSIDGIREKKINIDMKDWDSGIYCLSMISETGIWTKKIVR